MSRISKIIELGIEDLTEELYAEYRNYSIVAQELNRRNFPVSMTQVRSFITAMEASTLSPSFSAPPYEEVQESGGEITFPPLSEVVPYGSAPSIFDVVENLDHDHQYLVKIMQRAVPTVDVALKVLREKREQEKMFVSVAERAKSYREMFAFIQDVVAVLEEVDPRVKKLFLERLQQRQALRITPVADRSLPGE